MVQLARAFGETAWVKTSEIYAFVDGGKLWLQDRPGLAATDFDLGSAGAGVRLGVFDNTSLTIELARAIDVVSEGVDEHGWRTAISLGAVF